MSDCRRFERSMQLLVGDEIGTEEHDWLLRHTETCPACESMFEVHLDLSDPSLALTRSDEEELLGVRRSVLREIRHRDAAAAAPRISWISWLSWRPALAAGTAALLLAAGFLAGRMGAGADAGDSLLLEMDRAAVRNVSLRETVDSAYAYRNVRLRDEGNDRVALSFDVSTHVEVVRPKDDPLVAEVLVQSMLDDESLGNRLKAVSRSADFFDPRVEEALLASMLFDISLPVRLKALTRLADRPVGGAVHDAMLQVVASEDSVQMRLLAIDHLTKNQVPRDDLERAMDSGVPGQRFAVYARAEPYLERR